ncbi:MAG TPA: Rrf2 family transcriptional regulator [Chthoniobacteraceae bacterium]|jgi:Rrf2 family protein|nr:transcriptional regulator, BadM/Rrf2 family [Chthoniobacter sp.]HEV7869535.1 Rrf2 family transcriptional regulator [Chthoniobacteraceae bacterium]
MAASCRFAFALHVLAVLAMHPGTGVTSKLLGASVNTHPVVIRRLISALRKAGFVCCASGAKGGATLCRPPEEISLDAIYQAIQPARAFAAHPQQPDAGCPVGRQIKTVLADVFSTAEQALHESLAQRTLADVVATMSEEVPSPLRTRPPRRAVRA